MTRLPGLKMWSLVISARLKFLLPLNRVVENPVREDKREKKEKSLKSDEDGGDMF